MGTLEYPEMCILGRSFRRPVLMIAGLELTHAFIGWDIIDGAKNDYFWF
jgi:hypothetical protein